MRLTENNTTRKMLNIIRESEDSLVNVTPEEIKKAESELQVATGDNQVEIKSFKVYPEEKNVIIVATLPNAGDISVQMIYNEPEGIYINANNAQMSATNLRILNGLSGFYKEFEKEWKAKFNDEYSV